MRGPFAVFVALLLTPMLASAAQVNSGDIVFANGGSTFPLHYTASDIGGGLFRYDIWLDGPLVYGDGQYFIDALGFTGVISQSGYKAGKSTIPVDSDTDAEFYDGILGYHEAVDSYYYGSFGYADATDTSKAVGATLRTYATTSSEGIGDLTNIVRVAKIVAQDNSIGVSGLIKPGHYGNWHEVQGTNIMWAPEPSTLALAAIGALGLFARFIGRRLSTRC